ncbi:uncharacterized protein F5147DRAFT_58363 [Suillus discolor]|uniref:Uncharacterized protein n=1 Tax=Suillus discolor TaxID=1912936 RepID=A0A9P7FB21_9AGAM|nr:uncharacterized protein F5147DRAFT_58363 [Suillus discolor]KAG2112986.1 hypothetical protein F5147DRAFT_58363 [Suillus discolor]
MIIALPDAHPADSCLSFGLVFLLPRLPAQFPSSDDWRPCWDPTNQLYVSEASIILPTSATILDYGSSTGASARARIFKIERDKEIWPGEETSLPVESSMAPASASSFGTSGADWEDGESEEDEDEVIEFSTSNVRFFHDC